jgi:hypothetical protein
MSTLIRIDGVDRPVTDAWAEQNIKPYVELASWTHDRLEAERTRLLNKSQQSARFAPGVLYSGEDEKRLQAVTRVINAHRATRAFLTTRTLDEFGFTGVDQLHGNSATYPCGCKLHYVFDHHKAIAGEELEHFPHEPLKVCETHAHMAGDFKAHFAAVRAAASADVT